MSNVRTRLVECRLEDRTTPSAIPVGSEITVNTYTTDPQSVCAIAKDATGDFVVVWQSYFQDGSFEGIYAQRFNSVGLPQGSEFQVNTTTTNFQQDPAVAMDADGDFMIVWESGQQDGSGFGVYGRRYFADGSPNGGEFRVNTTTSQNQVNPAVAMTPTGLAVVVWQSNDQLGGAGNDIYFQRYDTFGMPVGIETRANIVTSSQQNNPTVAMDSSGQFVVAWDGFVMSGSLFGLGAQRFDAGGTPQGAMIIVSFGASNTGQPSIAMGAGGDFALAWHNDVGDGFGFGVFARRYSSGGAPITGEIPVNQFTSNGQQSPTIAMDAAGNIVIAWTSVFQDSPSSTGVYARRFGPTGSALSSEFLVNVSNTTGNQSSPAAAMESDGDFVVAWVSDIFIGPLGSNNIFAQRFSSTAHVDSIQINGGAAQRSRVTEIAVEFSTQVTIDPGAFVLTRQGGSSVGTLSVNPSIIDGRTVATLTFSGAQTEFTSLVDGRYTLTIDDLAITDPLGGNLDGDGNGISGGDFVLVGDTTNKLFRLFGDVDGNGTTNNADFAIFRSAFGGSSIAFDFDNNSTVGTTDFIAFRQRFGASI